MDWAYYWDIAKPYAGLVILIALFVAFVGERRPPAVTAVVAAALMLAIGLLSSNDLLSVFSNPAPLTIGAMFILSGALVRTGVIEALAGFAARKAAYTRKAQETNSTVEQFAFTSGCNLFMRTSAGE